MSMCPHTDKLILAEHVVVEYGGDQHCRCERPVRAPLAVRFTKRTQVSERVAARSRSRTRRMTR
jgi:hypothetical protein